MLRNNGVCGVSKKINVKVIREIKFKNKLIIFTYYLKLLFNFKSYY